MKHSIFTHCKGIYAILSAFILVIFALVLVLGILYYELFIANVEQAFKRDLNRYEIAKDSRNRIFYCYGNVIDPEKFNQSCDIPLIKGFKINRTNAINCSSIGFSPKEIRLFDQIFVYSVPIKENNKVCLGKLELFI